MRFSLRTVASVATAILVCFSLSQTCFAEPNETDQTNDAAITAPQDLLWYGSRPVGHTAVYLGTYLPDTVKAFEESGYDVTIQYDWSFDGDGDWHYTAEWDDYEMSPMFDKVGEDDILISEAFWLLYDETYAMFSLVAETETDAEDGEVRYIDFAEHPVYMRARYIATPDDGTDGEVIISEWSQASPVMDESSVDESIDAVTPPVLSDINVNEGEVSFCLTSDASFRRAALLKKLLGSGDYKLEYKLTSSSAEITAVLPYYEGINILTLPEDVSLSNEGIMTLEAKILSEAETGIEVIDNVPSVAAVSFGNEPQESAPVSSEMPSAASSEAPANKLNNTQIGAILVGIIVLAVVLAVAISSIGKKRRKRTAW